MQRLAQKAYVSATTRADGWEIKKDVLFYGYAQKKLVCWIFRLLHIMHLRVQLNCQLNCFALS